MMPRLIVIAIVLVLVVVVTYTPIMQCFGAVFLFWLLAVSKGALKPGRD